MTTKQRKALQAVVLEAGEGITLGADSVRYTFSCIALDCAFRQQTGCASEGLLSTAYWHDLFGGAGDETVGDRAGVDDFKGESRKIRLLMLALTHTLIGSGDFEAITGYRPNIS